jgi:NADH-dependent peroxiredoxin subunit C
MSIQVGRKAPDFTAKAYAKGQFTDVSLADYRGRWVMLVFYPGDFTFVCPTELKEIATHYEELKKLKVEVLACSIDSHFVHKSWDDNELSRMIKGGIPYPMLADPAGKIGSLYNVFDEEINQNIRGRFIIDPDGIMQAAEILTPPVGRNTSEMIRQIKAFQFAREHGGEVCPASWVAGEKTLHPGVDLVGKVADVLK